MPLASIPVTMHSSSELVRLCLRKHDSDESEDSNSEDSDDEQYEEFEDVVSI